ncbi:MAG: cytidylate kinase family protein [Clostridia bacterium]|nr:cytidylate kinase family protein [Clostridia bacterium]
MISFGEGNLSRLMLKFSIPCILSQLVSSLYNIVDQIFIGNSELSALGNAATGVVFPVFIIAQAFAWCFGDGCAAYLNICQGKNDYENAHRAIGASITAAFVAGLAMMAVIYPFKVPILTLFGASENTIGYAIEYLDIVLAMMPIFILCNMMNSAIRADGSPTWAMVSMLAGAVTNIILDPVFIFGFKWGMAGAAWATVIGQGVTFILTLIYFTRTKTFKLTKSSFIPRLDALVEVVKLGISTFFTQLAIVIVAILSNIQLAKFGALSKYGADIPIAIIGIQSKVFTLVLNLVVGIVLGCQPIISFNMGARKYDRVKELYRKIMGCTIVIGLAATLLFELAPDFVIGLFGTPSNIPNPEDYWEFGRKTLRIFLSLTTISCLIKMNSIFFQAVGKPVHAVVASMIRDVVCFTPLILILPLISPDVILILYAAPISDIIAMIVTAFLSVSFIKSLHAPVVSEEVEAVLKPSRPGVIITIAREHGSSGKQIGKLVAEKLGIPFYYKEMTALAAKESGLDREFIADINTNSPAILHSLYLSTDVIQQAVAAQDKVIKMIADQGSCVIVGRAADHVLRDNPNLLRVFIYAPEEFRIGRIMEVYGDTREEAIKYIRRSDDARASYYKSISGKTWGSRHNYDLVVNSSVGLEKAAEIICGHAGYKS